MGRRLVGGLHERLAEPGARLLPLALGAPQLTLLHAVHFPTNSRTLVKSIIINFIFLSDFPNIDVKLIAVQSLHKNI